MTGRVLFSPGFSPVIGAPVNLRNRFNGFRFDPNGQESKPLKRLSTLLNGQNLTGLKPGVNER
jgi:hypothetical protein